MIGSSQPFASFVELDVELVAWEQSGFIRVDTAKNVVVNLEELVRREYCPRRVQRR